jgi:hypothetical protein
LDGTCTDTRIRLGYKFDNAINSPDAQFSVIYEQLGTKGIILKKGAAFAKSTGATTTLTFTNIRWCCSTCLTVAPSSPTARMNIAKLR